MVGGGGCFFQDGVGRDHFARDQIPADAKMLERALGLSAPQLVRGHLNHTKAVTFFSRVGHVISPGSGMSLLTPRSHSMRGWYIFLCYKRILRTRLEHHVC